MTPLVVRTADPHDYARGVWAGAPPFAPVPRSLEALCERHPARYEAGGDDYGRVWLRPRERVGGRTLRTLGPFLDFWQADVAIRAELEALGWRCSPATSNAPQASTERTDHG